MWANYSAKWLMNFGIFNNSTPKGENRHLKPDPSLMSLFDMFFWRLIRLEAYGRIKKMPQYICASQLHWNLWWVSPKYWWLLVAFCWNAPDYASIHMLVKKRALSGDRLFVFMWSTSTNGYQSFVNVSTPTSYTATASVFISVFITPSRHYAFSIQLCYF